MRRGETRTLDSMSDFLLYGLVGLMFYQVYVTVRLVQSKSFTSEQKWRHALFIWLVPFIGAAATLAVLTSKDAAPQKPDDR
jgi:TRAP-type C4-dicarboxylate transport system permease small subunit